MAIVVFVGIGVQESIISFPVGLLSESNRDLGRRPKLHVPDIYATTPSPPPPFHFIRSIALYNASKILNKLPSMGLEHAINEVNLTLRKAIIWVCGPAAKAAHA